MARKVIDIIYNLVRKRLTLKGDGTGITSLPDSARVKRGMENVFKRLKEGGYNPVTAEKAIQSEDDLARVLEEINQKEQAILKLNLFKQQRQKEMNDAVQEVMDKMATGKPLNPLDRKKLESSGFKVDASKDMFKGFEPRVIPGGKKPRDKKFKGGVINAIKNLLKKSKPKKSGDKIYGVGGEEIDVADLKKSLGLDEATDKKSMEDLEKKLQMIIGRDRTKHSKGGITAAVKKLQKKFGKDIIQKGKAPKKSEKKKLQDLFREFNRKNKAGGGLAYMLGEPRENFGDGGMSRRTFLKIMAALAAFPVVGKLTKMTKVAKGTAPLVTKTSEMPEHFPKLVEKILREGTVVDSQFVKKTGNVKTYRHPDRPDMELTIEGDGQRIQLDFETDQGMRGGYEFKKGIPDETVRKPPDEFESGEVKYRMSPDGDYSKDFELGIDTGTENLDEFVGIKKQKTSKSKVNLPESLDDDFAEGGLAGLLGE
jgi:hypothetical protein